MTGEYGYYQQEAQQRPPISFGAKAMLAALGLVAGHRALVGVRRTMFMKKFKDIAASRLSGSTKSEILRNIQMPHPYRVWMTKKVMKP